MKGVVLIAMAIAAILLELLFIYFIMPLPGSQTGQTLNLAYTLYTYRWFFRTLVWVLFFYLAWKQGFKRKWINFSVLGLIAVVCTAIPYCMSADKLFLQPTQLILTTKENNAIPEDAVVIAVNINGDQRAYPVRYIGYHHQVRDKAGGKDIMITYCTVCHTGRVYQPTIEGKLENFRLVGMDHFNAMFEDATTKSWWRQANGEAVAGKLKGKKLQEVLSIQTTVKAFFEMYPQGRIMQADPVFSNNYDKEGKFEKGISKSSLTGTDTMAGSNKSLVLGIEWLGNSIFYEWEKVKNKKIWIDSLGNSRFVVSIPLANENAFYVFQVPFNAQIKNGKIVIDNLIYSAFGTEEKSGDQLPQVNGYQEFRHSWLAFHPYSKLH